MTHDWSRLVVPEKGVNNVKDCRRHMLDVFKRQNLHIQRTCGFTQPSLGIHSTLSWYAVQLQRQDTFAMS